ncbi:hypothetical protein D3C77_757120 [compost metagenome]
MAEAYKRSPEEILQILASNGSLGSLSEDVQLRKAIKFLVENSKEIAADEYEAKYAKQEEATEEVKEESAE